MRKTSLWIVLFGVIVSFTGLQAAKFGPVNPDPNGARPIDAVDTVFIEDMTWMEVRDAMKAGKDVPALLPMPGIIASLLHSFLHDRSS